MLDEPTFGLPLWLLADLGRAFDRDRSRPRSEAELRSDAELALELARRLARRPEAFAELMVADVLSDVWLIELPMALAVGELLDQAVAVGDAHAELDQDNSAMYASDVAVILAEAGRRQQALARVKQNLHRYPDDLWTHIHAGDVHLALADQTCAARVPRRDHGRALAW